jgi:adenine C2-methylase RlmN of 23S rRNA A2503 and tRNA A37
LGVQEREKRGKPKTKVMVEYVLIAGVNDSHEVAMEVGALLNCPFDAGGPL